MPEIHEKEGDALRADRIAIKALKIQKGELQHASGKHRIQTVILEDDVYCVIEVPLIYFRR